MPAQHLPFLSPGEDFPPVATAWPAQSDAPGLLAVGGDLSVGSLRRAYARGIFPWFSEGEPILWWSTDPRLVLNPAQFHWAASNRKLVRSLVRQGRLQVSFDRCFPKVIAQCAQIKRLGQRGTWINPQMVAAYCALHEAGAAHSVETWVDGALCGGLYAVALGKMVFGESMFSAKPNASKIALAALVAFCRRENVPLIDCQQETAHLQSLGAHTMPRAEFVQQVAKAIAQPVLSWRIPPDLTELC